MKANELMIGDWVQYDRSYPPMGVMKPIQVTLQDLIDISQMEECVSIPLTAEILVDNGWHYDYELHHWWHKGVEFMIFENDTDGFYCCFITSIDLSDIHKLQQLLRLCGLNELADNFKI